MVDEAYNNSSSSSLLPLRWLYEKNLVYMGFGHWMSMDHQNTTWHGVPKRTIVILLAAALIYVGIWVFFSPQLFASTDEYAYAKNAFLLGEGKLFVDTPELYCQNVTLPSGKVASNYPIGKSLQLIPFTWLARMDALFLAGLLTHLLNFLLVILILRTKKIDSIWAIAYLAFPAFQWESRTLYAELWLLTFYLGAFLTWIRGSRFGSTLAGFLLGLAIFVRYDAILGLAAFALFALVSERHRLIPLLMGAAVPIAVLLGYNTMVYGGPLTTGYGSISSLAGVGIPLGQLVSELLTFPLLVFVTLPFSLWAAYRSKEQRVLFLSLAVLMFLFFVRFYSFWALGTSITQIFTVRLRYFIPLLGLLLIPTLEWYAEKWKGISSRLSLSARNKNALFALAGVLLIGGTIAIHSTHHRFLEERLAINSAIHAVIPENARIIGSADDCMHFLPAVNGKKYYVDVSKNPALGTHEPTYVVQISYSTQEDNGTPRQGVVDAQRKQLDLFVQSHQDRLIKVYDGDAVHLTIWRYSP